MTDETAPATQERTPSPADERDTDPGIGADTTGTPTSAARRRRRRGGRGRGSRGRGTGAGAAGAGATGAAPADDQPEIDLDAQPGETERIRAVPSEDVGAEGTSVTPTAAARRRRRGGRGRGSGTRVPATGDGAAAPAEGSSDGAAPEVETAGDAPEASGEPAEDVAAPRKRRRRGGRGRGTRPASEGTEASEDATEGEPKATRTRSRTTSTKAPGSTRPKEAKPSRRSGQQAGSDEAPTSTRLKRQRQSRQVRRRRDVSPPVERITDKLMVITEHGERDQIAVLEGRELVQHYVTRQGAHSMVGNVYLGRVQNVLPGMEAAFVDVGRGRNAVLYAGEVNWSPEDPEGTPPRIEHALKNGQSVLVQVTKDPIGGKGARLTAQISLPGRYLVLAPDSNVTGISRRLPDTERRRLKTIYKQIKPDRHGLIVRTAAEGASEEELAGDLQRLVQEWESIEKRAKKAKAPAVLYEEPELTLRAVRDLFTDEEYRELVTDSPRIFRLIADYLRDVAPDLLAKVRLHEGKLPAFEEFHVVEQIHKGLDRKVWLPSGGYIIIERTEALTVVDVNTGKSVGKTNLEETVVNTNVEAAREIARQLRLRDIGGMIVIDFIDMLLEQNKDSVIDAMKEALAQDKSRSQVFDISPLGLLEVTRKRVSGGLLDAFSETCPTCEGRGVLLTYDVN
ncbi:MAG: Rne/Rng family ribonuclease [Actinomycetota bacterium]